MDNDDQKSVCYQDQNVYEFCFLQWLVRAKRPVDASPKYVGELVRHAYVL